MTSINKPKTQNMKKNTTEQDRKDATNHAAIMWWHNLSNDKQAELRNRYYPQSIVLQKAQVVEVWEAETTAPAPITESVKDEGYTPGEMYYTVKEGQSIGIDLYEYPKTHPVFFTAEHPINSEQRAKRIVETWNGWDALKEENKRLNEEKKELAEAFEKRGTQLREYQSTLKMLTEAATGSSITNWPQLRIAKELLNK